MSEKPQGRFPELFTLSLIGGVLEGMRRDTEKDIEGLCDRGIRATELLARCLPYLRGPEAKALRAQAVALLEESQAPPPAKEG